MVNLFQSSFCLKRPSFNCLIHFYKRELIPTRGIFLLGTMAANERNNFNYHPLHFVRPHSKNNDLADIQTQILEVVFEPDPQKNSKTTSRVATCGGNTISILDINSGKILLEYKFDDIEENFYTLAWTTLTLDGEKTNILASGGIRGEIRMMHPQNKVMFHEWRPVEKKSTAVNSLVFHTSQPTWLFCGTSNGEVSLWDVGTPSLPTYDVANPSMLLKLQAYCSDVKKISWSGDQSNWLLAGTAAGLIGWNVEADKVLEQGRMYKPKLVDFLLPESTKDNGENPIVDSVAVVGEWNIVVKCALHGLIYLWDLKSTTESLTEETKKGNIIEKRARVLSILKWSQTERYFPEKPFNMNLGCHKGVGLVVCGDDKGTIWLYNMPTMVQTCPEPIKKVVNPTAKLIWPDVEVDHLEKSSKVQLDWQNIVINKVATSYDKKTIVAVTSNNVVCIWRSTEEETGDK